MERDFFLVNQTLLETIRDTAQRFAQVIAKTLDGDVLIVDNNLNVIGKTSLYFRLNAHVDIHCVIGQILMDATKLTAPRVLVILVTAGALLQAFHLYEPLVNLAQTGARVPLPGFGYSLAKGAMEGAKENLLEAVTGGIKAAAGGITVAIGWGYLIALVFNPKSVR